MTSDAQLAQTFEEYIAPNSGSVHVILRDWEGEMKDYETYQKEETLGTRFKRFTSWLSRRPMESWGFFIAGLITARILF